MTPIERPRRRTYWTMAIVTLSLGIAIGTLSGVAMVGSSQVSHLSSHPEPSLSEFLGLPDNAIHATATHGVDNFAIATGMLNDQTEAIFFLDFVTGELKGAAISRQTNKFSALYKRDIMKDFDKGEDPEKNKDPRFLLVTGLGSIQQRGGQGRVGRSLIYVVEVNSGKVAAYATPSSRTTRATGTPSRGKFLLIDMLTLRKRGVSRD